MTTSPQQPGPQPTPPQATPPPVAPAPASASEEKTWAMFCHLAAFACFVGIPFGNIVGPLIVWLIKKQEMPLVDDQGKESLNFQITVAIAGAILIAFAFISGILCRVYIGFVLLPLALLALAALGIGVIIMVIMAAIKTNAGERYRYPYSLRLIK